MFSASPFSAIRNLSLVTMGSFLVDVAPGNFQPQLVPTAHAIEDSVDIGPPAERTAQLIEESKKSESPLWPLFLGLGAVGGAAAIGRRLWLSSRQAGAVAFLHRTTQARLNIPSVSVTPPNTKDEKLIWHTDLRAHFIVGLKRFIENKQRVVGYDFQINMFEEATPHGDFKCYFFTKDKGCVKITYRTQTNILKIEFADDFNWENPSSGNYRTVLLSHVGEDMPQVYDKDFFISQLPDGSELSLAALTESEGSQKPVWLVYLEPREEDGIYSPTCDYDDDDFDTPDEE